MLSITGTFIRIRIQGDTQNRLCIGCLLVSCVVQVVRADLTELRDLDLEGNPYGYTPFCESRKEMDGFRFWKSGYWANHLGVCCSIASVLGNTG